jgi:MFS family permease
MATEVAPAAAEPKREAAIPPRRAGLDGFELAVLAVLAAASLWILALDVWQVVVHHRTWTGTDGEFLADQMQYLAWVRDSSHHFLVSDLFVLRGTPHDYFQPIVVVSGALTALGVPPWISLLVWKPVSVLAVFLAVRAFVRGSLADRFDRRVALVLALFFGSWGTLGDEWIPFWSWGYPFALLGIAALAGALVCYARDRDRDRVSWKAPLLGLAASLSHPWQGELLLLTVIGAELVAWRRGTLLRRRLRLPAATLAATALPLIYFEALDRFDPAWRAAQQAAKHHFALGTIALPLIPLLIASTLAYRRRPQSFLGVATRVWPFAALVIYALSETGLAGTPLHAFAGITIPLAVLAVEGVQSIGFSRLPRWRLVGAVLVALGTIPASISMLRGAHPYVDPMPQNATFIIRSERRALDYLLNDPRPGGVLARNYFGLIVPEETSRRTYIGLCLWSEPHCITRMNDTIALMDGHDRPLAAQAFVRSTGARFVLQDCQSRGDLRRALGPMITSTRRFGCAGVYGVS